ncbi:hypothetical protein DBR32_01275 [Taibaiella sp. KBW10]|uniref:hypothetical protein n=1 Tax=Taibaiella sp. KBW10 TaxID=2153357 RepID=UPI000F5A050A|nr:hypothetical protein [Taibaiella sp. KBW10]RQO32269.1 hypothetical protein DBR32_01275 [Taibaiella sp. KBW10]
MTRPGNLLLIILLLFNSPIVFAQMIDRTTYCGRDTYEVNNQNSLKHLGDTTFVPYQVVSCRKVGRLGLRLEVGYLHQQYQGSTKNWLGTRSEGLGGGAAIVYNHWNIGVKFRTATTINRQTMTIGDRLVEKDTTVNMNHIDYFVGYGFNIPGNFSVEPFIALGLNETLALHYDASKPGTVSHNLGKLSSFVSGITINKYFRVESDNHFLALFATVEYNHAHYKKLNSYLSTGNTAFNVGIAYKIFGINSHYRRL